MSFDNLENDSLEIVNKENSNVPPIEKVDLEEYKEDVRRHRNSLIENSDGLPKSLYDLDEISTRQILFFVEDHLNKYTGKKTYGNITESFMLSGFYPDSFLEDNFKVIENVDLLGQVVGKEYQYDLKVYQKIEIQAMQNWFKKDLDKVYREIIKIKNAGLENEEIIKDGIMSVVKNASNENIKIKALNLAMKAFGIEKKSQNTVINLYQNNGGKEHNRVIVEATGNDNYDLGLEEDE